MLYFKHKVYTQYCDFNIEELATNKTAKIMIIGLSTAEISTIMNVFSNKDIWFSEYRINPENERRTVYYADNHRIILSDHNDAEYIQNRMISDRMSQIDESYLKGGSAKLGMYTKMSQHYNYYSQSLSDAQNYMRHYVNCKNDSMSHYNRMLQVTKIFKNFEKFGIVDGRKVFEFSNVMAEDTDARGDDILIEKIMFEVNFENPAVYVIGGENPKDGYSSGVYHPHQLSGGSICLGSQESDFYEAVGNVDVDIVHAILSKFVSAYTSSDSAGATWVAWAGKVWSDWYDDYINEEDSVWSDIDGCRILTMDAVEVIGGGGWAHSDSDNIEWSEWYEKHIDRSDAVYSEYMNTYILADDAVQLTTCDGYIHADHEDIRTFNDGVYTVDEMVTDIEGNEVPEAECLWGSTLEAWILSDSAINYDGDYYTESTLPNEDKEEKTEG